MPGIWSTIPLVRRWIYTPGSKFFLWYYNGNLSSMLASYLEDDKALQQKLITYAILISNIRNRRFEWATGLSILISNIFICIFTLVIIGTKTSEKYLSAAASTISVFFYFYYLPCHFSCTDSFYNFFMVTFFKLTQDLTLVPTRYPNLPVIIHKIFC